MFKSLPRSNLTYKDEIEKVDLLLPERDILAHRSYELILRESVESRYGASLEDTHQSGGYTIRVVASGVSPETGAAFQRTRLATVLVTD